jgi:hypothetical protein
MNIDKEINIVYFIWINENIDWKSIICGQLNDIIESDILSNAHLHIVLTANSSILTKDAYDLIFNSLRNMDDLLLDITTFLKNEYEYQGIKKLYDLANMYPNKYYLYLHSKGMFNRNGISRSKDEVILTKSILKDWKDNISIFKKNKNIVRMGMFPADGGWVWFNFFWATGRYLRTCEEPKLTSDRYYYESWLCNSIMREFSSYSLFTKNMSRFSGIDAGNFLLSLRNKF